MPCGGCGRGIARSKASHASAAPSRQKEPGRCPRLRSGRRRTRRCSRRAAALADARARTCRRMQLQRGAARSRRSSLCRPPTVSGSPGKATSFALRSYLLSPRSCSPPAGRGRHRVHRAWAGGSRRGVVLGISIARLQQNAPAPAPVPSPPFQYGSLPPRWMGGRPRDKGWELVEVGPNAWPSRRHPPPAVPGDVGSTRETFHRL